jgi:hypothetical protein
MGLFENKLFGLTTEEVMGWIKLHESFVICAIWNIDYFEEAFASGHCRAKKAH